MNATVLFEGCGGSTAGLHQAGYTTVGFEYWQPAVTCAQANGFDARLHDLSDPTLDDAVPYAPLWWASPPCQPFSAAGQGEGEFDDRDGFPWLLRLVAKRLPEVLIVENVKGLTFRKHSAYFCAVLEGFRALGYEVDWRVLNCADLGVPQTRERCIIVCRRDGGPITWPAPTHCETGGMFTDKWVTMADALGWHEADAITYNRGKGMSERHGERPPTPATLPAPTVHNNFVKDMRRLRAGSEKGQFTPRVPVDKPSPTIMFGNAFPDWQWIDDDGTATRVEIAEAATLQGFCADWTWTGTKTQQARMVGNAVPPALAAAVARVNRPHVLERAA